VELIDLPGGEFMMGDDSPWTYPDDGEGLRAATVPPFAIGKYAVTNAEFAEFVDATGYRTESERFGWSFVFAGLLPDDFDETRGVVGAEWWRQVMGASWAHPEGRETTIADRLDHPVVHVSWRDCAAFCEWAELRLPTEAEWEYAAKGGATTVFPWGDELLASGSHMMNVFQGEFPGGNEGADGWFGTCPVDAFAPNGFGLHNVTGNVWEWTADRFDVTGDDRRVMKGGSYLCHESYCRRYRPAARMANTADSAAGNVGFRVIR
jgi:formylglycine-generating enzyme required for sulfatase activity